jgi:hypothetical protein
MKIIKVTYTVQPQFAEQNKTNIQAVMSDLQKLNAPGINYNACLGADGKTFIHTAFFENDEDQKTLNELPSFKYFQEQLKASAPETPPKPEMLNLVGSSKNVF